MIKIFLVGCGHMGSALLSSWIAMNSHSFFVYDPLNYRKLKKKFNNKKIKFYNKTPTQKDILTFDIICFAVKPQIALKVINEYKHFEFKQNSVIISIIAGKKLSFFKKNIKNSSQIVRIMPNMPALINSGISCIVPNEHLSKFNKNKIENLFLKVGKTLWFKNEIEIDKATAISGSGPGYIFTLIDAFESAAIKLGFSKKISRELILSTFIGSSKLMEITKKDPKKLANSISVKGGTTEAGIKILKNNNINEIMYNTFSNAFKRASKLGK